MPGFYVSHDRSQKTDKKRKPDKQEPNKPIAEYSISEAFFSNKELVQKQLYIEDKFNVGQSGDTKGIHFSLKQVLSMEKDETSQVIQENTVNNNCPDRENDPEKIKISGWLIFAGGILYLAGWYFESTLLIFGALLILVAALILYFLGIIEVIKTGQKTGVRKYEYIISFILMLLLIPYLVLLWYWLISGKIAIGI